MKLLELRTAVANKLRELPDFKSVEAHSGSFGIEVLKGFSTLLPAARVAILQVTPMERNNVGQFIGPAQVAVYVVARDPLQSDSWGPAIDLAEIVADAVELETWGLDFVAPARVTSLDVIFSPEVDATGLCVAGVIFSQEITFGRSRHDEDEMGDLYASATLGQIITPEGNIP